MNHIVPPFIHLENAQIPSRMEQLTYPAQFIIRSYRSWLSGVQHNDGRAWNDVWAQFTETYGTRNGKLALTWFVRMIGVLQAHAPRTIRYHQPGCPCVGDDERLFLSVITACQTGDAAGAGRAAQSLVVSGGVSDLVAAAGQLALVMVQVDHRLDHRKTVHDDIGLDELKPLSRAIN